MEEEPINAANVAKVSVKEAEEGNEMEEEGRLEVRDRGLELAPFVTDGVETKGVTSAPRSAKQM